MNRNGLKDGFSNGSMDFKTNICKQFDSCSDFGDFMDRIVKVKDKSCKTCKWHDDFTWACFNGDSPNRADFTDNDDLCGEWAENDGKTTKRTSKSQNG